MKKIATAVLFVLFAKMSFAQMANKVTPNVAVPRAHALNICYVDTVNQNGLFNASLDSISLKETTIIGLTADLGGKFNTPTGTSSQYIRGDGTLGTTPTVSAPTYNYGVTRPVNSTSFTPSTTQNYRVYYNVEISCTASIGSTSSGSVVLQYFNGTSWVNTGGAIKNSNTVTLAIVLNSVTVQGGTISGEFPANTQLRLVSTSTGTTTITYNTGQEVLY